MTDSTTFEFQDASQFRVETTCEWVAAPFNQNKIEEHCALDGISATFNKFESVGEESVVILLLYPILSEIIDHNSRHHFQ